MQLGKLQDSLPEIESLGAQVVALSVDPAADSTALADKLGLSFPLLVDDARIVTRAWKMQEEGAKDIARPATFVIAPDGKIVMQHVGDNPRDRPNVDAVLEALAKLKPH